jgi:salicylate hydroxylase
MVSFHRAEFLEILENHIPPHYRVHFSKRLVSYEDSAPKPIVLHFKDGTTGECDILVGADGVKSAVRRTMFTDLAAKAQDEGQAAAYRRCIDATWSGLVTYRALVKSEDFKTEYPEHIALTSPICVRTSALLEVLSY